MVLAAGLGTRLRPLTNERAKSLVPIGDRPALAHVVERLQAAGVPTIVVNAHHRADDLRRFARHGDAPIALSEEESLLGTAGGLAFAAGLLGHGDAIVWNADVMADVDLLGLVRSHESANAEATLVVEPRPRMQGSVGLNARGDIVRLRQERFGEEWLGAEFLGISVVGEALRGRLPKRGCLVGDAWLPALRTGATLRAFPHRAGWHDIGTLEGYMAANLRWLEARSLTCWVGRDSCVDPGATLDRTVLGEGAVAVGSGAMARSVVWPGARAVVPLADSVVTEEAVVLVRR